MKHLSLAAALSLVAAPSAAPALANDSEAEWALGGLTLKPNADISMDKEELFLSVDEVRVAATNRAAAAPARGGASRSRAGARARASAAW